MDGFLMSWKCAWVRHGLEVRLPSSWAGSKLPFLIGGLPDGPRQVRPGVTDGGGGKENDPFHTAHGHLPFALWGGAEEDALQEKCTHDTYTI